MDSIPASVAPPYFVCETCSTVFRRANWRSVPNLPRFCSRKCHRDAPEGRGRVCLKPLETPLAITCMGCGRRVEREPGKSLLKSQKFCSKGCWRTFQRKRCERICENCGRLFYARQYSEVRHFCSRRCSVESRENPNAEGRKSWRYYQWRKAVLERDQVCQTCGSDDRVEAHHIYPWADYPALRYEISNGIALCWEHHAAEHPDVGWLKVRVR